MNVTASNFVKLQLNASHKICSFLVDTGADISILKFGSVKPNWTYNPENHCSIRGIANEEKKSYGTIECLIVTEGYSIENSFHLVGNDFPVPTDGILGRDFLTRYKCEINYDTWMLTAYCNGICAQLPIYDNLNGSIVIPARSEVIRHLSNLKTDSDVVIEATQIKPGVFCASTIVNKHSPCIRFINVTEEDIVINNFNPKTLSLDDFDIFNITTNVNQERFKQLQEELSLEKYHITLRNDC